MPEDDRTVTDPPATDPPPADPPADAGAEELARWKQASRRHERDAKTARTALAEATAELEKLRTASQTESERALATARTEALAEGERAARARYSTQLATAALIAAATGKLRSPELAARLVDVDQITVAEDGTVDQASVKAAVDTLLSDHPELAATAAGSFDQGARGTTGPAAPSMDDLLRAAARGT